MKNAQKLKSAATLPEVEELTTDASLVSALEAASEARKAAYDKWVVSLPQAGEGDVAGIVKEIKTGFRPSTSIPKLVELPIEGSEDKLVKRIDKDTPAHEAVNTAIVNRQKVLKSKAGRAKVDETVKSMTCTSFTLRTKKSKSGAVKATANVRFES